MKCYVNKSVLIQEKVQLYCNTRACCDGQLAIISAIADAWSFIQCNKYLQSRRNIIERDGRTILDKFARENIRLRNMLIVLHRYINNSIRKQNGLVNRYFADDNFLLQKYFVCQGNSTAKQMPSVRALTQLRNKCNFFLRGYYQRLQASFAKLA